MMPSQFTLDRMMQDAEYERCLRADQERERLEEEAARLQRETTEDDDDDDEQPEAPLTLDELRRRRMRFFGSEEPRRARCGATCKSGKRCKRFVAQGRSACAAHTSRTT